MNVLNQRDDKWKDIKLGSSDKTIGSHGCTITCIAMLADLTPDEVNRRLLNVNGYANGNLVIWSKIKEAIPWLEFSWRGYSYDNDKVAENLPCLVEVNGQRIGAQKHWVLYIGNQKMHDPWYGNIKSTSYYPPTGYSIIKRIGEPPTNMNYEEKYNECRIERDKWWEFKVEILKYLEIVTDPIKATFEEAQRVIGGFKSRCTDMSKQLGAALAEIGNRKEQVSRLKDSLLKKDEEIKALLEANNSVEKMVLKYKGMLEVEQGQVNALSKEKGALNIQIAELKIGNSLSGFTIKELLIEVFKKLLNIK